MQLKPSTVSKIAGASLLTLTLAIFPSAIPAEAQTNSAPAQNNPAQNNTDSNPVIIDRTPLQESKQDNNHWGALGLLGILGLANLFRKNEPKAYRDPMQGE